MFGLCIYHFIGRVGKVQNSRVSDRFVLLLLHADSMSSSSSSSSKNDRESESLLPDDKSDVSVETSVHDNWTFEQYKSEGACHVFYRWSKPTEVKRGIVIGPDWFCSLMAFVAILIPAVLSFLFLLESQIEEILLSIFVTVAVLSLIVVVLLDPGIVRKHHRSKSKRWTYWCVDI